MAMKQPPPAMTRVKIVERRTIYVGASPHPFRQGDEFDLPEADAQHLIGMGHVQPVTPAAPAAPAAEPGAEPPKPA